MKWVYDKDVDAAHLTLDDAAVDESEEVSPGVVFDFDANGRIVGIEVSQASARLPASALFPFAA
jgi:uncharacterized protein YuzE